MKLKCVHLVVKDGKRVLIEPQVDFYNYGKVPDGDYYALCRPIDCGGKVWWECMNFVEANERRETYSNLLFT